MGEKERRSNSGTIFLAFIFICQSVNISAQVEIPDSVITERLQLIEKMLNQGKPGANCWWYGWLAGYSAATIGQGVVCISSNDKVTKQDMALGAVTTLLGATGQLLTPMLLTRSLQRPRYGHNQQKQLKTIEIIVRDIKRERTRLP